MKRNRRRKRKLSAYVVHRREEGLEREGAGFYGFCVEDRV